MWDGENISTLFSSTNNTSLKLDYNTASQEVNVGTIAISGTANNKLLGITIDSTKSGIESETNSNIKYVIKF